MILESFKKNFVIHDSKNPRLCAEDWDRRAEYDHKTFESLGLTFAVGFDNISSLDMYRRDQ